MVSDRKATAQEDSTEARACTLCITFPWPREKSNQVDLEVLKSCHEWVGGTWVPPSLHIPASQKLFPAKTGASLTKNHTSKTDICHLNSTLTTKPLENFTEQVVIMEIKSRAGNKLFHEFLNSILAPKTWSHWGLPLCNAERRTPWACRLSINHSICKTTREDFTPTDIYIDTATPQSYLQNHCE